MNIRKTLLWALGIVLSPFILFVLLVALLYIPPIQKWAVDKAASVASKSTGMDITVGRVSICFPLDLALDDVRALRQNDSLPQLRDTIADVGRVKLDVELLPLLSSKVNVDNLEILRMRMNTSTLIHSMRIKGSLQHAQLSSHGIWLSGDSLNVDFADIDSADIDIALSDTVPPDTTTSENFWKIYARQLAVTRSNVVVHMPGDTLKVGVAMGSLEAAEGVFDLHKQAYLLRSIDWKDGALTYDNNFKIRTKGLDYNHLALTGVNIGVDSLYYCDPTMTLNLRNCAFREKSGIVVDSLSGPVRMDSLRLMLPAMMLKTPESTLRANVMMDFNAFDDHNPGQLTVIVHGSLGKMDIMRFMDGVAPEFCKNWPNYPLRIDGVLKGNMRHAVLQGVDISLPTAFRLRADGVVGNVTDTDNMLADVKMHADTYNLGFITRMMGLSGNVTIPSGISIDGNVNMRGAQIAADFKASQGGGTMTGKAAVNTKRMAYSADVRTHNLPVQNFVRGMGLKPLTASINIKGAGTDFMSATTAADGDVVIRKFGISGYPLDNITAQLRLSKGVGHASINSDNNLVRGVLNLDALMGKKGLRATFTGELDKIDLNKLRITDYPMVARCCAHVDMASDLEDYYKVYGNIGDIVIVDSANTYRPEDIDMDILTRVDTTHAIVYCGDFQLDLDAQGGYKRLLKSSDMLMAEIHRQMDNRYIDHALMRQQMPLASVRLRTGSNNFIMRTLQRMGYSADKVDMDMTCSPQEGLNGNLAINKIIADGIQIDTVRLVVVSDSTAMTWRGRICNNRKNPQYVFNALFDGGVGGNNAFLNASLYDADNKLGIRTGMTAAMEDNGIRLSLSDRDQIFGYKKFHANADNYAFLANDRRVSAKLKLVADDGTGVQIYSNDSTEALQDITLSMNDFDLKRTLSVIPYAPDITGVLNGDLHFMQTSDEITVASDITVDKMTYGGCAIGKLGMELVYMPKGDGSHFVSGNMLVDDHDVGVIMGSYNPEGKGSIDATVDLTRMPLSVINGFIPDRIIGFKGYGEGQLDVKGQLDAPVVNGEVYLDSCYLVSEPYGVELRFDDDPVSIVGSHLLFENFEMYAHNESPLNMSGSLDFSNLDKMMLDLKMRAVNFNVINAKENARSETFGKAYVNMFALMSGPLDNLSMRGRLDVLGSTDMTYILRDSPLSNDNQLDGLVEFVDFADSTAIDVARPPLTGFNMDMTVVVDEGARVVCQLNADGSNYVDVQGGGSLRLQYNTSDNVRLSGRYTLGNGEMKYSLPVIPLKTFTIREGSYVDFTGDPMNPKLSIYATEQTKASVGSESSQGRTVTFDCGVQISKRLQDMGLEFVIDAPNDMTVHSELMSLSTEERGKIAVAMLTTGMYIVDGNTSSFSMNAALSAFLNSQITSITGNALRTLDLSFGVDNTTTSRGTTQTDYSFKFAKRFWNNRLRISVGGKVSTGADVADQNEEFFNNVTFEYRLNQNSTKYLKLFYDRDSYDWLEGNVGEFGAGFLWRRKLMHFSDIFRLRDDNGEIPVERNDTLKKKKTVSVDSTKVTKGTVKSE